MSSGDLEACWRVFVAFLLLLLAVVALAGAILAVLAIGRVLVVEVL